MIHSLKALLPIAALLFSIACGISSAGSSSISSTTPSDSENTDDEGDDLVENRTFAYTIIVDFTNSTAQLGSDAAQAITEAGTTLVSGETTSVSLAKTAYGVTIASTVDVNVKYVLTGSLEGTLTVTSESAYELYLDGVSITATQAPAVNLQTKKRVFIVTADGTANTLTDAAVRASDMDYNGALHGKGQMVFSGDGTLYVTGHYKHAIKTNDYIRMRGGTINATATAGNGIHAINGFYVDDGTLTVKATSTTADAEGKGIKVEGSEDNPGEGNILISGGTVNVTSVDKGICATWKAADDASTASTADDPSPSVAITGGTVSVTTTGTPNTTCSPEGIESKTALSVSGGTVTVSANDDCFNAGSSIAISGGYIRAASSSNDAIDSNGTMTISGGVIVASGAAAPEEAFDCDSNTFTVTGGTFVGVAGATSTPTASVCTQNCVILGSGTAGQTMALAAADGTIAFAFTIPQSYSTMLLSSAAVKTGTSYTVYTGGTAAGDSVFNGLYLGSLTYSGGSSGTSFTVSSTVTGSSSGGGGNPGGGPGGRTL